MSADSNKTTEPAKTQSASVSLSISIKESATYTCENLSLPRQIIVIATVCMAMFTNQLGLGQTMDMAGVIGEWYQIEDPAKLSWLVAGYSLTVGTLILIAGRFGDNFGHKMFVFGMGWVRTLDISCWVSRLLGSYTLYHRPRYAGYRSFWFRDHGTGGRTLRAKRRTWRSLCLAVQLLLVQLPALRRVVFFFFRWSDGPGPTGVPQLR